MKKGRPFAAFLVLLLCTLSAKAQGTFQNLNFEAATLSPSTSALYVSAASALPGWSAYLGTTLQTEIYQNGYTTGAQSIDIFGPNYQSVGPQSPQNQGIIDGNYTVFLQAGFPDPQEENASIEQNGTVPLGAQSLQFKAWDWLPSTTIFTVSFNGNILSPVVVGSGANYTLYGANISTFAGQNGELEFSSIFNASGPSWVELDDITFSGNSVPEPTTLALIVMSGAALAALRWRSKRA